MASPDLFDTFVNGIERSTNRIQRQQTPEGLIAATNVWIRFVEQPRFEEVIKTAKMGSSLNVMKRKMRSYMNELRADA